MISQFSVKLSAPDHRHPDVIDDIPWLDKMCCREDCPQYDANASNSHVRDTQERVLSTHHSTGG